MSNTIGCANEMHDKGKQKKKNQIFAELIFTLIKKNLQREIFF